MSKPEPTTESARFTKERLETDLQDLRRQLAQAEQQVQQWQGKASALVGAVSYCAELLKAYGVTTEPPANTKPVDKPQRKPRKLKALPNGKVPADTGGSVAPKVE